MTWHLYCGAASHMFTTTHEQRHPAQAYADTQRSTYRLESTQRQPAVHRRQPSTFAVLQEVQLLPKLWIPYCQHAQCGITMATDVLCTAGHADVSTQVQGPLVQWGQEAVVHTHQRASGMGNGDDGGDVTHLQTALW